MTQDIKYSLSEIRFYVTRAGYGVGMPFGIGEELAELAVRLARRAIDPAPLMVPVLRNFDSGKTCAEIVFEQDGTQAVMRSAESGAALSSAYAAPAAADCSAAASEAGARLTVKQTDQPLLIAAAVAAAEIDAQTVISWQPEDSSSPVGVICSHQGMAAFGDVLTLIESYCDISIVRNVDTHADAEALPDVRQALIDDGVALEAEAWAQIVNFFQQSLVPSNAQSRLSGAGAGLVDRD